jgi:hypothetical protein
LHSKKRTSLCLSLCLYPIVACCWLCWMLDVGCWMLAGCHIKYKI